ncbi:curli assembly protein CsgF [Moheibacter stercoris]|uniref:Curli production assembly/transport component CsgF n=1 Tax=Moheibacter stercoris TaxID=1628251 RepID=A0ABV2LW24_9FLAO
MKTLLITILLCILSQFSNAQQLSYTPINPAFGGSYLNYSWLLSSANAQNSFDDNKTNLLSQSLLGSFSDSLKRQILNQLTRSLLNQGGEGGAEEETIEIGGLIITIENTRTGSIITIIDSETGETTEIIL